MQIESMLMIEKGEKEKALELLEKAALMESELPVSFGPPSIVKPAYELLGDQHLKLGNYKEALEFYEKQLVRTPYRRRSFEGKKLAMESIAE